MSDPMQALKRVVLAYPDRDEMARVAMEALSATDGRDAPPNSHNPNGLGGTGVA